MVSKRDLVVLITGCSSGIGRALTEEFAARGHRVFVTARSRESLADLETERVRSASLDVTDAESIQSSFGARAAVDVDRFQEGSLYSSLEDQIQERAAMPQKNPTPVGEFASKVVDAVTATNSPAVFRSGHGSRILSVMAHLPVRLRDRILSRRFKLERLQ